MLRCKVLKHVCASARSLAALAPAASSATLAAAPRRSFAAAPSPNEAVKRQLGRPGNSVKIGIVGMPNIGKSTMFNCLSMQNVPASNFPFCTIDPNNAVVRVPDPRMEWLTTVVKPQSTVPAVLSITDIAGLVKGASEGKGLGNEFLSHIGAVDAIYHLVRVFPNKASRSIEHVEGSVDPIRDLEIISHELIAKDIARVRQAHEKLAKLASKTSADAYKVAQVAAYKKALDLLEAGRDVREGLWTEMEADALTELALLSAKPIVYLLNASADDFLSGKCEWYKPVREWVAKRSPGAPSLIFSGDWEADLMLMEGEERAGYIADSVAETPRAADAEPLMVAESTSYVQAAAYADAAKTHSMLPAIITSGYSALNLQQYFTVGEVEVRAWTIKKDTLAPGAAGVIHSDFEKNFICGEIYAYDDIYALGSEDAVKKAGKLKTQGKAYVMQDGDICEWRHGARK